MMNIYATCDICNMTHKIEVQETDYNAWQNGELIQHAMPYLTDGQRELLISHTCEKCFDEMFEELEEE